MHRSSSKLTKTRNNERTQMLLLFFFPPFPNQQTTQVAIAAIHRHIFPHQKPTSEGRDQECNIPFPVIFEKEKKGGEKIRQIEISRRIPPFFSSPQPPPIITSGFLEAFFKEKLPKRHFLALSHFSLFRRRGKIFYFLPPSGFGGLPPSFHSPHSPSTSTQLSPIFKDPPPCRSKLDRMLGMVGKWTVGPSWALDRKFVPFFSPPCSFWAAIEWGWGGNAGH